MSVMPLSRVPLCLVVALTMAAAAFAQPAPGGRGAGQAGPGGGRGAAVPGAPPRDVAGPARTGTAQLHGRVVSSDGAPVRRATIRLGGGPRRAATTDADGRFVVTDLPAGRFTVTADKPGYVPFAHGQRVMNEPGTPVTVADGETVTGIDIVLPRGSAITGRVVDEYGEAVVQGQVQAFRYEYQPDGQRRLVPSGSAMTDDLGQFRVYGLIPGEYAVSAASRVGFVTVQGQFELMTLNAGGSVGAATEDEGYPPTYYPGTINPAEALAVPIGLGQETSVALQLVPMRMGRISGVVVDSQNRPVPNAMVVLRNVGVAGASAAGTQANGEFTVRNVPPGNYMLDVRSRGGRGRGNGNGDPGEFASVPVSSSGDDVSGLYIVTGTGATVTGRVVFEGTSPRGGGQVRVVAQPVEGAGAPAMQARGQGDGAVAADGSFTMTGIGGSTFFRIAGLPQGWMTKSVTIDGVEMADTPFDPAGRASVDGVRIVLTDRLTEIAGSVADMTVPVNVIVVPAVLPPGASPLRFVRTVRPDADGRFSVRGLPEAGYVVAAVDVEQSSRQYEPSFQDWVRQVGRSVTAREGRPATLTLRRVVP